MSVRKFLIDYSKGDSLRRYRKQFRRRERSKSGLMADILTFRLNRAAHKHGGYIGRGAVLEDIPSLPHGLHGIYISRYAVIGPGCRIYQNATVGEVDGLAPRIGANCLIGSGAVIVGGISIGDNVRIGAGAVVSSDIPDNSTVVSQPPRIIERGVTGYAEYKREVLA